ncbi:hypothetical protein GBAR_LOCUS28525, partial [Geodia barretti]
DGSRHGHLLHAAVGSGADSDASESHVGEDERPQLWILGEKAFRGHFSCCGSRQSDLAGLSVATVQDEDDDQGPSSLRWVRVCVCVWVAPQKCYNNVRMRASC